MKVVEKVIPERIDIIPASKVIRYISKNGREFYTENTCIHYENTLEYNKIKNTIKDELFNKLKSIDDKYFYCNTKEDFNLFKKYEALEYGLSSLPELFYNEQVLNYEFINPDWYWIEIEMDDYSDEENYVLYSLTNKKEEFKNLKNKYIELFNKFTL